jgi:PAB-dependent poly(A)-specific ribonuclease subunit 2
VGHGLSQDFATLNIAVPPSQIIDTVIIYHKPAQRLVSLRFLANFVLKRDMQQDIHDSVEDAMAAYELYLQAVELKRMDALTAEVTEKGDEGPIGTSSFNSLLDELYLYGQKTDWKLGVD